MKRIAMPKTWPLGRKGKQRFILEPKGLKESSLAVLAIVRDLLKLAKTREEARKILQQGAVFVNNRKVSSENFPVGIFDIVSIPKINKHFMLCLKGKKLALQEIAEKNACTKIFKIIGKKVLNKSKIQFNLFSGKNFVSDIKARVNDSVVWDLKQDKLARVLPLKENAKVSIVGGKNAGAEGVIAGIAGKNLSVKIEDKIVKVPIQKIWVIG